MKIGIIGAGKIFNAYAKGAAHYQDIDLAAVADLDVERAQAVAKEHEIPWSGSVDDLLNNDDIELVINLTIPGAHAAVDKAIIEAGKHAYSEKPLALNRDEIAPVQALAADKGLRLGCAPDTFLGAGIQTCRKLIDDGAIGRPTGATAFMAGPGHESWHPSPQFYYQQGGGPLFDMGPYYLTALVTLLGPVQAVAGFTGRAHEQRTITSEPLNGTVMDVDVDTHYSTSLQFSSGVLANMMMSFDVYKHNLPRIEIYGTEGSLFVPDPNTFRGPVLMSKKRDDLEEMELIGEDGMRGAGVADMVVAIREGKQHRANDRLAFHVLDVMQSITESGSAGAIQHISSTCERPELIASGLADGAWA